LVDLFRGRKWDLVGRRNLWFALSLVVIITGCYFLFTQGLNRGIDFTGGGLITYRLPEPVPTGQEASVLARAREAVAATGYDVRLQIAGSAATRDLLLVRTRVEADADQSAVVDEQRAQLLPALDAAFPGIREDAYDVVSAVVSAELLTKAVKAVLWGCLFILIWIRIRYFDFKWAGSALLALVHDVLVLLGVFAITQREINSPFVAAALTVVGYSVHDTIVLFDRVRENLRLRKGSTFAETANISLLETMARSVNTVLTVLLVLIAVYFWGGASLQNFTFALLVGMTAGGYSSIFVAAQILAVLKLREEAGIARRRAAGGRPAREPARRAGATPRSAPAPAEASAGGPAETAEEPAGSAEPAAAAAAKGQAKRAPRSARRKLKAGRKRKKRF
jgi:preprotein translocase subunit SecF